MERLRTARQFEHGFALADLNALLLPCLALELFNNNVVITQNPPLCSRTT